MSIIFEPMVIETEGRGVEKSFPLFSRLLKDRIILLSGEIVDDMSTIICAQLLYLDGKDSKAPIYMYINSPGGVITSGLAIADTMNFVSAPVIAVAMGQACSMGSYLLTVADKRLSLPSTRIMYHSLSGGIEGTIHDMEVQIQESRRLQEALITKIHEKSNGKKTLEEIKQITARDWFISADEALEFGFIDGIISNKEDAKKFK
jgi:ATP-dependent Clp protease protease subunit